MQINAYAKINLTLDITGRREDGYHLLRMVMQSISLHDTLTVSKTENGIFVHCGREDVPCGESNTAYKAAFAFFEYTGLRDAGIQIHIEKRISSQAGLGGGSADAAAALHALNHLYRTELTNAELCRIGLTVGADVPFCVCGGAALAEGIGESLTPVSLMPPCALVICKPPANVSTKEAYSIADAHQFPTGDKTSAMLKALSGGDLNAVSSSLGNAFAEILKIPEVEEVHKKLCDAGAVNACMTGSGSAVYGIFEKEQIAQSCAAVLKKEYPQTFVCFPQKQSFNIVE